MRHNSLSTFLTVTALLLGLPIALHAAETPNSAPVRVILDTDMSGDCDDAGALAVLHALADRGECELLAVVTNRKDKTNASAAAVDAIDTYYGRPNIPVGTDQQGPTALQRNSPYAPALRDNFPHDMVSDDRAPHALDVYRRTLAAQPNGSVTICSVGALSNVAQLWRREPELVRTKVQRLVVMGGQFPKSSRPETNIATHCEAARVVAADWPGEIDWHGFEVGHALITGARLKQASKDNPIRRAYELKPFGRRPAIEGGQPSWDQGAALFAVRGAEPQLWELVRGGRVQVAADGNTRWVPDATGRHAYVKIKGAPARLAAAIEELMIQPPSRLGSTAKPNVIVILTDDQGYGDLSCHGNPVLKTPHLDRLHAQSVRFTDFHVAPMCTPTRGQLMSGVDCLRNGAMNVSSGRALLRRDLPTMADLFAAGGYRCGQFGKWHLGDNYPYRPQDRGFHEALYYPSSHIGSAPDFWNNHYFNDTYWHNGRREQFHGYTTDVFFDEAMKWIRAQAAAKKPFFCYLPTAAAHGPLFVPERYRRLYEGVAFPDAGPQQREAITRFFGMIANIDDNLGRLETFLAENGLRDNTILIFVTDNGGTVGVPVFNAGMKGGKVTLWEGGHRAACLIRWPGGSLRVPGDVAELTQVQDILPTLAELCALPTLNAHFDGLSLAELLQGKTDALPDRMLVIHYSRMSNPVPTKQGAAVLWKRWRLLEDRELYDLTTDPQQQRNVIEKYPEIAAKMRAHLDAWWRTIQPTINDFGAVVIGNDAETPSQLSPADWQDSFLDQGRQVREGLRRNGAWNVVVDRAGSYEFELRRWPREADAALAAALPAHKHMAGEFPPGVALPIAHARVKIGSYDARCAGRSEAGDVHGAAAGWPHATADLVLRRRGP